jgi:hypothetical protein
MENLRDKILNTIQNNYETFKGTNEAELQSAEDVTEITTDIAIKFAEWLGEATYYKNTWFDRHNHSLHNTTTQDLFKEFINNYYGK